MRRLWLKIKLWWLERHVDGPFDPSVSMEIDRTIEELERED